MFGRERNAINVYFNEGYKLKDNKKLLGGRGRIGRSIRIYSLDQISEIKDYIKQAYENSLR